MPELIDAVTGEVIFVPDEEVQARLAVGEVRYPEAARVLQRSDRIPGLETVGGVGELPDHFAPVSDTEQREYELEREYGDSPIKAGLLGVARGATIGGSDALAGALGFGRDVEQIAQRNRGVSTGAELFGAIAPALIPGGQFTAAGAVSRAGLAYSRAGANATRLARASRAAVAGGAEGFVYGAGLSLGESVRRGEDLSVAGAQALADGAMGAAFGAVAGGGLDLAGSALGRIREPLARRRAALQTVDEVDIVAPDAAATAAKIDELGEVSYLPRGDTGDPRYRAVMQDLGEQQVEVRSAVEAYTKAADNAVAAQKGLDAAQAELNAMYSAGASMDEIAKKSGEIEILSNGLKEARRNASPAAREKFEAGLRKEAEKVRPQLVENLERTVRVTRGTIDKVRSYTKLTAEMGGLSRATVDAAKATDRALRTFDDIFIDSIEKSTSGGGLTAEKMAIKGGLPERLENTGTLKDVAAAFAADRVAAREAIQELDRVGLVLARQLAEEGGARFRAQIPDTATRLTDIFPDDAFMRIEDIAEQGARYADDTLAEVAGGAVGQQDDALRQAQAEITKAKEELKAMRASVASKAKTGRVEKAVGKQADKADAAEAAFDRERARLHEAENALADKEAALRQVREDQYKQHMRANEGRLAERDALMANAEEGRAFADELEQLAKEAGILDKAGISSVDLAMIAVEVGVDSPELEWMNRLAFLSRLFGKRGTSGALARAAAKGVDVGGRAAAGAAGILPGGRMLAAAIDMGSKGAAKRLRRLGQGATKRTVRPGEARALFEQRLDKAMKKIRRQSVIPRQVAIVAPHTTLARARFAQVDHGTNYSGLDKDAAEFEKRAAELEATQAEHEQMFDKAAAQLEKTVDAPPDAVAGMAESMVRGVSYLHKKLPPRRSVGGDQIRRHASSSEIRVFARRVRYVQDPGAVIDDLAAGTLSPEGPEALREVYPPLFQRLQLQIVDEFAEDPKGEKYPRGQRRYLGRAFDLPQIDSTLRPSFFGAMQGSAGPAQPEPPPPPRNNLKLSTNQPTESGRHLS